MGDRPVLVLASASQARRALLSAAGIDPEIIVSGVDESAVDATTPEVLCATLARMKAHAVVQHLRQHQGADAVHGARLVLGCDSVLAFAGQILGKPENADSARQRWQDMRGRHGVLHTGHCLIELASGRTAEQVGATTVHFADLTDGEIAAYIATGEPLHVAGGFTLDGFSGPFVQRIEGDHGNVIGLSLPLLRDLLRRLDWSITDLWR